MRRTILSTAVLIGAIVTSGGGSAAAARIPHARDRHAAAYPAAQRPPSRRFHGPSQAMMRGGYVGQVTAVTTGGSTFTLQAFNGTSYSVQASSSTQYVYGGPRHQTASATNVTVGTRVAVHGSLSGGTITAQQVIIMPAWPMGGNHHPRR